MYQSIVNPTNNKKISIYNYWLIPFMMIRNNMSIKESLYLKIYMKINLSKVNNF